MIDSKTKLFCIFGRPVKHSKSPVIHNSWFHYYHINATYLAFEIQNISNAVTALKTFNIQGASVTIPFKESVMEYLDWIDEDALNIGAVNTIVNKKGKLLGFNTDFNAAVKPLEPHGIENKKICILGGGGAARAVAYGIKKKRGDLVIVNRSIKKGKDLSLKFDAKFISLDQMNQMTSFDADIIINTTPIGMHPDVKVSPFPLHLLNPGMIVMDIIYNPLKTRLLNGAEKRGCTTIDGLSMFMHQGAAQFKLWTGIAPLIEVPAIKIL
jgi:shikimate dehydrogenase